MTLIDIVAYVTQISVIEQGQPVTSRIYVVNLRVFSHLVTGLTSHCCLALNPSRLGSSASLSNPDLRLAALRQLTIHKMAESSKQSIKTYKNAASSCFLRLTRSASIHLVPTPCEHNTE